MNAELIKALRECEYCNVCSIAVDGDCPFGGRDALEVAAADALEAAENRIAEMLPKEGEWKKILQNGDGTSDYECSACLGIIMNVPDDDEHPLCSFCPNCGAMMRGEHNAEI